MLDEKSLEARMQKSVEALRKDLTRIRTGLASPAMLDNVFVDYYGTRTPVPQVGAVTVPEPRTLAIKPWEKGMMQAIEKAIQESDLGFNPNNQGDSIFISVPPLNDERRRDLVKTVHQMAEEAKVGVRNVRRDGNDELKLMQKEGDLSEDDLRRGEGEVQKVTDEFIQKIDARTKTKESDILAV